MERLAIRAFGSRDELPRVDDELADLGVMGLGAALRVRSGRSAKRSTTVKKGSAS